MSSPNDKNTDTLSFLCGSLKMLIFGSMFSGKTTKLLNELTICADVGLSTLYINHQDDDRNTEGSDNNTTTHNSQFKGISNKITGIKTHNLSEVNVSEYDVIGIDEGQFYSDLEKTVRRWVLKNKKQVYIASLDGDFRIQSFGQAHKLICLCEAGGLVKLSAHCMNCMKTDVPYTRLNLVPASYSQRLSDSKKQKMIGGKDEYRAVCLKCHQENLN